MCGPGYGRVCVVGGVKYAMGAEYGAGYGVGCAEMKCVCGGADITKGNVVTGGGNVNGDATGIGACPVGCVYSYGACEEDEAALYVGVKGSDDTSRGGLLPRATFPRRASIRRTSDSCGFCTMGCGYGCVYGGDALGDTGDVAAPDHVSWLDVGETWIGDAGEIRGCW